MGLIKREGGLARDLHAGYKSNAELSGSRGGLKPPRCSIVVGQGPGLNALSMHQLGDHLNRVLTVAVKRV